MTEIPNQETSRQSHFSPSSVVTVTELNRYTKALLERALPLIWVAGEISNLTRAASGHIYFTLKDESAQVKCVLYRSKAQLVPWQLANGQQVEVRSLASLYEARGEFQLGVETMRRAGLGKLFEEFIRLKQRLEREGLFAAERKRPLPSLPQTIGIVSSPHAAALGDVIAALKRRAPCISLILYPSPVQGDGAAEKLAAAISSVKRHGKCEVLLVVRGGGSLEDLWAFNEEVVARAVVACPIPVVSGVGHESDTTIIDLVADLRGATPTAAAEIVSAGWFSAQARLSQISPRLTRGISVNFERLQQRLDDSSARLVHPARRLMDLNQRLEHAGRRLSAAAARLTQVSAISLAQVDKRLANRRPATYRLGSELAILGHRLKQAGAKHLDTSSHGLRKYVQALELLAPQATIARGYAIVRTATGDLVGNIDAVSLGQTISIQLSNGVLGARIESLETTPIQSVAVAADKKPH